MKLHLDLITLWVKLMESLNNQERDHLLDKNYMIRFLLNKNISKSAREHRKIKYKGTYNLSWQWDIKKLESLSKQELYDICKICKR